jgi:aryl-alcohol dehydrogenase-like predicted oxidoreductase
MRYRPFGVAGKAVSALSLTLRETAQLPNPQAWRGLIYGAMESGVNCFEAVSGSDAVALGLGEALKAVERRLLFLSLRVQADAHRPVGAEMLTAAVRNVLRQSGAGYLDLLMLDEAAYENLLPEGYRLLEDLRSTGVALQVGVCGKGPAVDDCIADASFEVLSTPFSLISDWATRRRVKEACLANMAVVAYDAMPAAFLKAPPGVPQKAGLFRASPKGQPLAGAGTYAFLHDTPGWTAEELCFAYALTEPSFATIQVDAHRLDVIEALAAVTDRELPTGAAAQIEMARFSHQQDEKKRA